MLFSLPLQSIALIDDIVTYSNLSKETLSKSNSLFSSDGSNIIWIVNVSVAFATILLLFQYLLLLAYLL